jgi:small subunit ribosomal protein S3
MGQKVNPVGLRLGINRTWDSRWFAARHEYGKLLHEDRAIRAHIMKDQREGGISRVIIERPHKKCRVTVHTARPGILIGKKGEKIERIRSDLARLTASEVHLNMVEIRKPEIDAVLIAESIAQQLERRVAFRRAMKRSVQSALRLGAVGIRINVAGRLGGAEIARTEWYREGRVPLHTLRADIDFGYGKAVTAYGIIGIKVWVFKGEIIEHDPMAAERKNAEMQESGGPRPRREDRDGGDRRERRGGRGGGPGGGRGGAGGGGGRGGAGGGAGGGAAPGGGDTPAPTTGA